MLSDWFEEPVETARNKFKDFETRVTRMFVDEPGRMKLLIVVDKLLTGFDAPSATYLYVDKKMQNHGLFQAFCRVNRLDGPTKEFGHIIDYRDLFKLFHTAVNDYTGEAFEDYANEDIKGLLKNNVETAKTRLQETLEAVSALCEPVEKPHGVDNLNKYKDYFWKVNYLDDAEEKLDQDKRTKLYKLTRSLIRSYAEISNDMPALGFDADTANLIKKDVRHYEKVCEVIQIVSEDHIDMKMYEPGMRFMINTYIRAEGSRMVSDLGGLSIMELIGKHGGSDAMDLLPEEIKNDPELSAEMIISNVRRLIVEKRTTNPAYYDKLSSIFEDLVEQTKLDSIDYEEYLHQLIEYVDKVDGPQYDTHYPSTINTAAKAALYDNLGNDADLSIKVDDAVRTSRKHDWKNSRIKVKEVRNAIKKALLGTEFEGQIETILNIVREQSDY